MKILRQIIAYFCDTFSTHCPRCHAHFYGFHKYATNVKIDHKHYRIVCHKCAPAPYSVPKETITDGR